MNNRGGIDMDLRSMLAKLEESMGDFGPPQSSEDGVVSDTTKAHDMPAQEPNIGVEEMIRMLESDLADEIKAIATYDAHIQVATCEKVKESLTHIRDEEKHHAEELKTLISLLQDGEKTDEPITEVTIPETLSEIEAAADLLIQSLLKFGYREDELSIFFKNLGQKAGVSKGGVTPQEIATSAQTTAFGLGLV